MDHQADLQRRVRARPLPPTPPPGTRTHLPSVPSSRDVVLPADGRLDARDGVAEQACRGGSIENVGSTSALERGHVSQLSAHTGSRGVAQEAGGSGTRSWAVLEGG